MLFVRDSTFVCCFSTLVSKNKLRNVLQFGVWHTFSLYLEHAVCFRATVALCVRMLHVLCGFCLLVCTPFVCLFLYSFDIGVVLKLVCRTFPVGIHHTQVLTMCSTLQGSHLPADHLLPLLHSSPPPPHPPLYLRQRSPFAFRWRHFHVLFTQSFPSPFMGALRIFSRPKHPLPSCMLHCVVLIYLISPLPM